MVWASSSTRQTAGRRSEDGFDVEFLDGDAAVLDALARQHVEPFDHGLRRAAAVRLDEADDDVFAVRAPAMRLVQHGVRLADAGEGAEEDAQPSASGGGALIALERAEEGVRVGHGRVLS